MAASVNLLQEKTWTGEFFAPDDYGSRFSGRLGYAPEAGVRLDYRVAGLAEPRAHSLLHAVLDSGEAATLLGRFSLPAQRMPSLQRGYLTHAGTVGFPCLLVGELVPVDAGWPIVAFTLTQMQEFFFPGGYKDWQRFQHDPLVQVRLDGCEIEVVARGQFGLAAPDLSAHFHSSNPAYLERLGACMEEVRQAFPDDWLMLKQDFRYEVVMRYDTPRSCEALYADIERLANLFAILMYRPVYPQWIETRRPEPGQIAGRCTLYPSMLVDPRTLSLCQRPASFFSLPITMNVIDLASVIRRWWQQADRFDVVVASLQYETGLRNRHALHGDWVLFASVLEDIGYSAEQNRREKYLYPLKHYASEGLQCRLFELLACEDLDAAGRAVGMIRDEIAHPKKPKKLLRRMTVAELGAASEILRMVLLGWVLDLLGVPVVVRERYQARVLPVGRLPVVVQSENNTIQSKSDSSSSDDSH